jgi:hypothetical protein
MNSKQITGKLPLILGAVSLFLVALLQPVGAMQEGGNDVAGKSNSLKHEGLAAQIHTKVKKILENFHRNMEAYYERTRVKKNPVIKMEPEVKAVKVQTQQQGDREALDEAYGHWHAAILDANTSQATAALTKEEKLSIYNAMDEADKPQILFYIDKKNLSTQFVTCLTIGDGDCFFYAAFTEKGENTEQVARKAAKLRNKLLQHLKDDQAANSLKFFVLEQYMHLLNDDDKHPDVPKSVRAIYPKLFRLYYKDVGQGNLEYDQIMKLIEDRISADDIRAYIRPLGTVKDGEESYIPLSDFPQIDEPARLLALWGRKQIRIFRINTATGNLDLLKTVGNKTDPIINILHDGKHFTRLYGYQNEKAQCEQIFSNYYDYRYLGL